MINYKELFVMAGLIAAQRWEVDIKDVQVMFTETPEKTKTGKSLYDHPEADENSVPIIEGVIEFEHWRKADQYDLWVGYSDATNTLAICTQQDGEWLKRV